VRKYTASAVAREWESLSSQWEGVFPDPGGAVPASRAVGGTGWAAGSLTNPLRVYPKALSQSL